MINVENKRLQILTVAEVFSRVIGTGLDPILLVGAGASVKSGIPTSADVVRLAMRWLYAHQMGWQPEDPRIAPSDVHRLLEEQPWYRTGEDLGEFFEKAMELIDQPRELRRRFLLHVLGQATNPSGGYEHLAALLHQRAIRSVLTTNFDDLVKVAYGPGALITIAKPNEYQAITTAPRYPQVIYLHGQAEYYMDRNLSEEVDHLDPDLIEQVLPLIRDHPVIVIGYRGAEPSVMVDLFNNNVERAGRFKHGVYWCVRGDIDAPNLRLHPLVLKLEERLGGNFAVVPIMDFDTFFLEYRSLWLDTSRRTVIQDDELRAIVDRPMILALPFDLRPAPGTAAQIQDWDSIRGLLRTYVARMDQEIPEDMSQQWCEDRLVELGLAVHDGESVSLTNGGALLLNKKPRMAARGAYVELRLPKRPPRAIDGSLWDQYDSTLALLQQVVRPIRIKGARSETVRPYPTDVMKEVIGNALIHRDYERPGPMVIEVGLDTIRIESPGGLEEGLVRRLLGSGFAQASSLRLPANILQRRIEHGERGRLLTAYRNRVLADLFFGVGIVDKAGSGLADALEAMEGVGGRLHVEVAEDNSTFVVILIRRPLRLDIRTRTARPVKASELVQTNLLDVHSIPEFVWSAPSQVRRPPDPQLDPSARTWPRFVSYDGRLFTFSNLNDPENPLHSLIDVTTIEKLDVASFGQGAEGQRRLVHLLHEILFHHLSRAGLRIDRDHKRAYYACTRGEARYVQYKGQAYQEKRRVAWWPGTERTYCVHKAAEFHFERYGKQLALRIMPTYVFTRDGAKVRIGGPEAGSLATRYSTEDYNPKMRADIFFWTGVLSRGDSPIALNGGKDASVLLAVKPVSGLLTPVLIDRDTGLRSNPERSRSSAKPRGDS